MKLVKTYLEQTIVYLQNMPLNDIETVINILRQAQTADRTLFIMGNGGSAATASHCAVDIAKNVIQQGKPRFKCIALTDNVPSMTAYANDLSYDMIFAEQLKGLAKPGDVVIGFSGSGNSPNVVKAMTWARENGLTVIAIGGRDGGQMKALAHASIIAPTQYMAQIEDAHLILNHVIALALLGEVRPPLM